MKKTFGAVSLYALVFMAGALSMMGVQSINKVERMTKTHTLLAPLLLSSEETNRVPTLLPAGTTLYFDKSYPEGFTRYIVYVNIDRYPLKLESPADPSLIAPIEGRPLEKADLARLIKDHPLTRRDLESILHTSGISKDDIREVLSNYLR